MGCSRVTLEVSANMSAVGYLELVKEILLPLSYTHS
jgi:hypothetical protein